MNTKLIEQRCRTNSDYACFERTIVDSKVVFTQYKPDNFEPFIYAFLEVEALLESRGFVFELGKGENHMHRNSEGTWVQVRETADEIASVHCPYDKECVGVYLGKTSVGVFSRSSHNVVEVPLTKYEVSCLQPSNIFMYFGSNTPKKGDKCYDVLGSIVGPG